MIKIIKKPGMHEYNCGCGCTFTFENEDVKYEYISDDTEYFTVNCPYCKRVLGTAFVIDNDDRSEIREMWRKKDDKEVWLTVKNLGKLYMDEEFIVANEPILFTVIDENNKIYLVMSYDSVSNVYHMVEISNNDLIDMLENRITMKQAFKKQKEIIRTLHDNSDNCVKCTKYDSTTFPSGFLPKEGEYYNLKYDYIKRYIEKLKQENT